VAAIEFKCFVGLQIQLEQLPTIVPHTSDLPDLSSLLQTREIIT